MGLQIANAIFTGVVALATVALVVATVQLWNVTRRIGERQEADTRILQRAYVSVDPMGIQPFISKEASLNGQMIVRNDGKLPAKNISHFVQIDTGGGERKDFPLGDVPPLSIVLSPGGSMLRGSSPLERGKMGGDEYIYIWGIVTYDDGFGKQRKTRFCHRYPRARAKEDGSIDRQHGRPHDWGVDAD